ncbi:MAG TPA: glycosyltransferase family 9 protein [Kineosporiaceae bacterium]|nr:glycosyltransferase family 9 protein [Kineosporiaceae bacterium]
MNRVLVTRLDSDGDVLLAGPAIRAVARRAEVTLLVSPAGEQAARMLPGVAEVVAWSCPWSGYTPPPVDAPQIRALVDLLAASRFDAALVLTSAHQSPLPAALLLKLAGVGWVGAISADYPGSLLDLRLRDAPGHEVQRALTLAEAAGYAPDPADDLRLAVRRPLPDPRVAVPGLPAGAYVAVHPGASVPARAPTPDHAARIVKALAGSGWPVVVTGGPQETALTAEVSAGIAVDLGGRTGFTQLAAVLDGASCLVSGNTGPAHLAAAVGTPVVSLFAPVVPRERWAPWGVPLRVLGEQAAPCAGSRARQCPVPGHPCLSGIDPDAVVAAVAELAAGARPPGPGRARSGGRTPRGRGSGRYPER